jgi:hypothetical protein
MYNIWSTLDYIINCINPFFGIFTKKYFNFRKKIFNKIRKQSINVIESINDLIIKNKVDEEKNKYINNILIYLESLDLSVYINESQFKLTNSVLLSCAKKLVPIIMYGIKTNIIMVGAKKYSFYIENDIFYMNENIYTKNTFKFNNRKLKISKCFENRNTTFTNIMRTLLNKSLDYMKNNYYVVCFCYSKKNINDNNIEDLYKFVIILKRLNNKI